MNKIIGVISVGSGIFFIFQNTSGSWLIGILICLIGVAIYKNNLGVIKGLGVITLGLLAFFIMKNKKDERDFKAGKGVVSTPTIIFESEQIRIIEIKQTTPEKWTVKFINFTSKVSSQGSESEANFSTGDTSILVTNHNRGENNENDSIRGSIHWN